MERDTSSPNNQLQHIRNVIKEQFGSELTYKEGELEQIEDRIRLAKLMLQRLRFGVLAQHYGVAGFYPASLDFSEENVGVQSSWISFEQEFLKRQSFEKEDGGGGSTATGDLSDGEKPLVGVSVLPHPLQSVGETSNYRGAEFGVKKKEFVLGPVPVKKNESTPPTTSIAKDTSQLSDDGRMLNSSDANGEDPHQLMLNQSIATPRPTPPSSSSDIHATPTPPHRVEVTRFYSKKRIIIGNTSQYLHPATTQEQVDGSTHKWMVYVRGPTEDADISSFVKAVRFFLHPSYHPNDIIRVTRPPFHLIRLGWGEFPIRVQLEFCDRRNKPVDVIHNLVLDRTHTGQQTLGAETIVDLDINPKKAGLPVCGPNGINHSLVNGHLATDEEFSPAAAKDEDKMAVGQNVLKPLSLPAQAGLKVDGHQDMAMSIRTSRESSNLSFKSSELSDSLNCQPSSSSPLIEEATPTSAPATVPSIRDSQTPQVLTTNLEKCLHSAVRVVPLYGRQSNSDDFHLTACTVDQFKSWSIGRRRAAEWMRALAVKRHVERKLRLNTSLLSTKQVMQWCRRNGYTLLDPCSSSGVGFCKYCGYQLNMNIASTSGVGGGGGGSEEVKADDSESSSMSHLRVHEHCREMYEGGRGQSSGTCIDMEGESETEEGAVTDQPSVPPPSSFQPLSSLSESEQLFTSLISSQAQLRRAKAAHAEDGDVDIETQPGCTSARARAYEHPVPRLRVPQTPELKWIQQTAASLGIHIYPAVIDRMYAHVVEHMVYMSCTRFLKAILVQSLQEAGRRVEGDLPNERVLTPLHVYQAVQSLDQCDFLTNKHLGLETHHVANEEGMVSEDDMSGSCTSSDDEG